MKRNYAKAFLTLILACGWMTAHAVPSLLGDTVNCGITSTSSWICSSPTAVVGPGVEFQLILPLDPASFGLDVDIGASSIRIASNRSNAFGLGGNELLTLSGLDFLPAANVVGIANLVSSGVSPFDATRITFTGHSVTIDIDHGSVWNSGSFVSFDLVTVPEPATLSLLGVALAGLGLSRRRKPN